MCSMAGASMSSSSGQPSARMSEHVTTPASRARRRISVAFSGPRNSGPPTCRKPADSSASHGTSSIVNVPLAPITCSAGRSPFGRIGRIVQEVWTSSRRASPEQSTPKRSNASTSTRPASSSPTAPTDSTEKPSFARVTAVPPAAPAGESRISSISAPPCPSGIASTGRPSTSRMWAPKATTSGTRGTVAEPPDLRGHVGELLLAHHGGCPYLRRVPVQRAGPLEQEGRIDGVCELDPAGQRPVVLHQRRRVTLERLQHVRVQLVGAEGRVRRHPHGPAELEHLVVDRRQLVEHAAERRRHRRVRVHHGPGPVEALVHAEVEAELRRRGGPVV